MQRTNSHTNQAMKHAFMALPATVLSTKVGRQVMRVMERQVGLKGGYSKKHAAH